MPLVKKVKDQSAIYGKANPNTMTFQERLMVRFQPHEYVTVMNIDNETFQWQYLPEHEETSSMTDDGMHRIIRRGEPEIWEIAPGAQETIVGSNAYLMIDGLYKKVIAKKSLESIVVKAGQARHFNFENGSAQDKFIDMILIGKAVASFDTISKVTQDLELDDDTETVHRGPGRPAKLTA
jgi:hypothetical protein